MNDLVTIPRALLQDLIDDVSDYAASREFKPREKAWRDDVIERARALLAPTQQSSGEVTGWQPIETAPKETELLGWRADCGVLLIMYTSFDRWASEAECEEIDEETLFQKDWFGTALPGIMDRLEGEQAPTHWMPLPTGPADAARAHQGSKQE
ncbi:hypothetical protein [Burkholderia cepacia]|uniref:hypothetical protein n=1 Tax=Burkholderia cepacia TaxID=292 RepID=UPI0012DAA427|nr:hypothetical protein [Burkholderia cepacia]